MFIRHDPPVQKVVLIFFKEEEQEVLGWSVNAPNLITIDNLWTILKKKLQKKICWKIWKRMCQTFDSDVVQNLNENYTTPSTRFYRS